MKHSLSMEVTHVSSYLGRFKKFALMCLDTSSTVFEKITNMNPEMEEYNDKVRKVIKDYDEDLNKDYEHEKDEFKLFITDITDIAKHRTDEYVIYSIRTFASTERELKEIKKKKLKKLINTVDDSRMYAKADGDYVITIAYANILNHLSQIDSKIEQVITRLNKITKLKEEDD